MVISRQYAVRHTFGLLCTTLLFSVLAGFGCGKPSSSPVAVSPVKESSQETMPTKKTPNDPTTKVSGVPSGETLVHVQALDRAGQPLAGLIPIATLQPNAFDEPLAKGEPTDTNGMGTVSVPSNKKVFVRIWDPSFQLFANNYLDVPSENESTQVQMITGATIEIALVTADNKPLPDTAVSLMMVHPRIGPWWPGESVTDKNGRIIFGPVPAGQFNLLLQTKSTGKAEVTEVVLMPGERKNIGSVCLQ